MAPAIDAVSEPVVGTVIKLEGNYSGADDNRFSNRCAVAIEDCQLFDMFDNELEWRKDHTWVQEAWEFKHIIKGLKIGDRVSCLVKVVQYKNKHGVNSIGFREPSRITWQPKV